MKVYQRNRHGGGNIRLFGPIILSGGASGMHDMRPLANQRCQLTWPSLAETG